MLQTNTPQYEMCTHVTCNVSRPWQSWDIVVSDQREKCRTWFPTFSSPYCCSLSIDDRWAWDNLSRPDPQLEQYLPDLDGLPALEPRQQSSILFELPSEIFDEVWNRLDRASALSLASTCLAMCHMAKPRIQSRIEASSRKWFGRPLACLGTWSSQTQSRVDSYRGPSHRPRMHFEVGMPYGIPLDDTLRNRTERQHWLYALDVLMFRYLYTRSVPRSIQDQILERIIYSNYTRRTSTTKDSSKLPSTDTNQKEPTIESSTEVVAYLRNLDTKEYVRIVQRERVQPNPDNSEKWEKRFFPPPFVPNWLTVDRYKSEFANRMCYVVDYKRYHSSNGRQSMTGAVKKRSLFPMQVRTQSGRNPIGSEPLEPCKDPQICPEYGLNPYYLEIEHLLALRAWWPSSTASRCPNSDFIQRLRRRSWAGSRFDIVSSRMHEHEVFTAALNREQPPPSKRIKTSEHTKSTPHHEDTSGHGGEEEEQDGIKGPWIDVTDMSAEMAMHMAASL